MLCIFQIYPNYLSSDLVGFILYFILYPSHCIATHLDYLELYAFYPIWHLLGVLKISFSLLDIHSLNYLNFHVFYFHWIIYIFEFLGENPILGFHNIHIHIGNSISELAW